MPTYSEMLWEEERRRREAAGIPPTAEGRTLPELMGAGISALGRGAKAVGRYVGGMMEPRIDPYTASMLEGQMVSPADEMMDLYSKFVGAGGEQLTFGDPRTGISTKVKVTRPEAPQEALRQGMSKQPPKPEQPQGQTNTMPGGEVMPGVYRGAQQITPQEAPKHPAWSGFMPQAPSPEEEAQMVAQAQQAEAARLYSPRYRLGEEPITARQRYEQERQMIQQAYPTRGEAMREAYGAVGSRYGKGMRILMSILNQDPFYTDKLAAAEMDYNLKRREGIYNAEMSAMTRLNQSEEKDRALVAGDLQNRLATNPKLKFNKAFNKDYAMANLGIPSDYVEQYIENHTDPKTGEIKLVRDPYEERKIVSVNTANLLQDLDPDMPRGIAIVLTRHPELSLQYYGDRKRQLEIQLASTADPMARKKIEDNLTRIRANESQIASDPAYRALIILENQRDNYWNRMSPQEKKDWGMRYKENYGRAFMPSNKTSDELFLDRKKDVVSINASLAQIASLREKTAQAKVSKNTIIDDVIRSQPGKIGYGTKQMGVKESENARLIDEEYRNRAKMGETFKTEAEKSYMNKYKFSAWNLFPTSLQEQMKDISYSEAVQVSEAVSDMQSKAVNAGIDPGTLTYPVYELFNLIMLQRRGNKPRK